MQRINISQAQFFEPEIRNVDSGSLIIINFDQSGSTFEASSCIAITFRQIVTPFWVNSHSN